MYFNQTKLIQYITYLIKVLILIEITKAYISFIEQVKPIFKYFNYHEVNLKNKIAQICAMCFFLVLIKTL